MRKLFLFLLLIAGWALIFYPLAAGGGGPVPASRAQPSKKPLPRAWEGNPPLQVRLPGETSLLDAAAAANAAAPACGTRYTLVSGDTLGKVAQRCGLTLSELLAANPAIRDPNRVNAGLELAMPNPLAGRGGGDTLLNAAPVSGYAPGAAVQVEASGLPPGAAARIGLGMSSSGYRVLAEVKVDAQGRVATSVTLPGSARPGDTAFLMLTTQGVPAVQRMSASFTISTR